MTEAAHPSPLTGLLGLFPTLEEIKDMIAAEIAAEAKHENGNPK